MKRIAVTLLFVGMLATPFLIQKLAARTPAASAPAGGYGFRLREISAEAGIDFRHRAPTLHRSLQHIMADVASMGASATVADFDRDGFADIYACTSGEGGRNALYRNLGNGRFEDVAERMGVADVNRPETGVSMGAVWGDYDNDGWDDLLLYRWGRPALFRNEQGKGFKEVTEGAGLPAWVNANNALWFDYDRDGKLDLFIGGYYREDLNLWDLKTTRIMPESFKYARNGSRKFLLRGRGDGTFEDVTSEVGLESRRWSLAAMAADLSGSGYPDLIIANDYGVSEYWRNEGGKRFREIGHENGLGERPTSGMNVSLGDIFNDGRSAIYITNIQEAGMLMEGNPLWVPEKAGDSGRFLNMAPDLGVALGGWSWGAQFCDLNNDGFQDLFCTNGFISANPKRSYWYAFSEITSANSAIISDAKNWPDLEDMSLSGYQKKNVWINDGAGKFVNVASLVGVSETYDGRAVAVADFWNRGAQDIVVSHQKGPLLLYRNELDPGRHWIQFELEGRRGHRSALGAMVKVSWAGQTQVQIVASASGFCAQNQRRLHYGLGGATSVDEVVIRWPSGQVQKLKSPAVDRLHRIVEPE